MSKSKIVLGWVIIALGLFAIIIAGLLTTEIDNPIVSILSPIACGIFGGCIAIGGGMIRAGKSNKASKQYKVEQHDERNIAIRGKAGYIAFFVMLLLVLAFSVYIFYIQNDRTTGFIGYGISIVSLLTYIILYKVFEKKM